MEKHHIGSGEMDLIIEQQDIHHLAQFFDDVELYIDIFRVPPGEKVDLRKMASFGNRWMIEQSLLTWRAHNPSKATFKLLLCILMTLKKTEVAYQVCLYLSTEKVSTQIFHPKPEAPTAAVISCFKPCK